MAFEQISNDRSARVVAGSYDRRLRAKAIQGQTLGGVAQLGERRLCKPEVIGSIPFASTKGA